MLLIGVRILVLLLIASSVTWWGRRRRFKKGIHLIKGQTKTVEEEERLLMKRYPFLGAVIKLELNHSTSVSRLYIRDRIKAAGAEPVTEGKADFTLCGSFHQDSFIVEFLQGEHFLGGGTYNKVVGDPVEAALRQLQYLLKRKADIDYAKTLLSSRLLEARTQLAESQRALKELEEATGAPSVKELSLPTVTRSD